MSKDESRKQKIGNIGVLDIRTAGAESVAQIEGIGNVGLLLYSPETAALIPHLRIGNLGSSLEVPADARLMSGQVVLNADSFAEGAPSTTLLVNGMILIADDVSPEMLEQYPGRIILAGQVICPRRLLGMLQTKIDSLLGQTFSYNIGAKISLGVLTLSESYLNGLADASELLVIGELRMPHLLPEELLSRKLGGLQVQGAILCHEENLAALSGRFSTLGNTAQITVIPAGYQLVEQALSLDAEMLAALPAKKLYCRQHVVIHSGVTASALDAALDALKTDRFILCPAVLKSAVARKCNVLDTRIITADGELIVLDNDTTLSNARLRRLVGKVTLAVFATVTIDEDLNDALFNEHIAAIHNFGAINVMSSQRSIIEAALGVSEGSVNISDAPPQEEADTANFLLGNAGMLRL